MERYYNFLQIFLDSLIDQEKLITIFEPILIKKILDN